MNRPFERAIPHAFTRQDLKDLRRLARLDLSVEGLLQQRLTLRRLTMRSEFDDRPDMVVGLARAFLINALLLAYVDAETSEDVQEKSCVLAEAMGRQPSSRLVTILEAALMEDVLALGITEWPLERARRPKPDK